MALHVDELTEHKVLSCVDAFPQMRTGIRGRRGHPRIQTTAEGSFAVAQHRETPEHKLRHFQDCKVFPISGYLQRPDVHGSIFFDLDPEFLPKDLAWGRGENVFQSVVDNEFVAGALAGRYVVPPRVLDMFEAVSKLILGLILDRKWRLPTEIGEPVEWRRRCFNKEADRVARYAMQCQRSFLCINPILNSLPNQPFHVLCHSDGGHNPETGATAAATVVRMRVHGVWQPVAVGAIFGQAAGNDSLTAEVRGLQLSLFLASSLASRADLGTVAKPVFTNILCTNPCFNWAPPAGE